MIKILFYYPETDVLDSTQLFLKRKRHHVGGGDVFGTRLLHHTITYFMVDYNNLVTLWGGIG